MQPDRFGIGWRAELAAGILSNLQRVDIVEVIADDYFDVSRKQIRSLQTLSAQVPLSLHAVGLGMASTIPVDRKRLNAMARLIDTLRPDSWSEHFAFVRAGGIELGHLAAPPRNANSVEGTLINLDTATRKIGTAPLMENVATMLNPLAARCPKQNGSIEYCLKAAVGCSSICTTYIQTRQISDSTPSSSFILYRWSVFVPFTLQAASRWVGGLWMITFTMFLTLSMSFCARSRASPPNLSQ